MQWIADLHLHSRFSMATSRDLNIPNIARGCHRKGINLVGTGDLTHPVWLDEIEAVLEPAGPGIYQYQGIHFILSGEVSQVYRQNGKARRIHNLIYVPDFKTARELNHQLDKYGKLASDGRPTLSLDGMSLVKLCKSINPDIEIVPAHIWTPWYALFGSKSGFNSFEECFGDQEEHIHAVETGLSSDPEMNWRWSKLDRMTLISNSDAHSPSKLGREANLLESPVNYRQLFDTIYGRGPGQFKGTLEFYPEEGKYHWDGHRACGICLIPSDAEKLGNICPVCGKPLTLGVLHRINDLSDREEGFQPGNRPSFERLIDLHSLLAEAMHKPVASKAVQQEYDRMIFEFGSEFYILRDLPEKEMDRISIKVREGLMRIRQGNIQVKPGFDGQFGVVSIWNDK